MLIEHLFPTDGSQPTLRELVTVVDSSVFATTSPEASPL